MVRGIALLSQSTALLHTETVLLVCNDQAEPGEDRTLRNQGVGADYQGDITRSQCFPDMFFFGFLHGAGQECTADAKRFQERREGAKMLLRQYFCRSHEGALLPVD